MNEIIVQLTTSHWTELHKDFIFPSESISSNSKCDPTPSRPTATVELAETVDKRGANQSEGRSHFIVLNIIVAVRGLGLFKCSRQPVSASREWNENQLHSFDTDASAQSTE